MTTVDESASAVVGHRLALAADVVLVVGYALVVGSALVLDVLGGPVRILLAAPLLGFLPGYALLSVCFPSHDGVHGGTNEAGAAATLSTDRLRSAGLAWFERCSLAVPASLAVIPPLSLAVSGIGTPLSAGPLVGATVAAVVLGMLGGLLRRRSLPKDRRYTVPVDRWTREARAALDGPPVDVALNVALVVVVVVATSGLTFALVAPDRGESYTEAALLTRENGTLVAGNYTTTVVQGEPMNVTLTVENQEGEDRTYTVVVVIQRVRTTDGGGGGGGDGSGDLTVLQQRELQRFDLSVADTDTATRRLSVRPQMLGQDLRLNVLVYEGQPPETVRPPRADHRLFLWVDVRATPQNTSRVRPLGAD